MSFHSDISESGDAERILVIRFSSLGDLLLTAPALRAIRKRFPHSSIDLLVAADYADAARLLPGADRILTYDRRSGFRGLLHLRSRLSRRYAILVDLQNSFRSVLLRSTTFPTLWVKARRQRFRRWLLIHLKRNFYREVLPVPVRYLNAVSMIGAHDDGSGLQLAVPADAQRAADAFAAVNGIELGRAIVFCPGARHTTKRWPAEYWIAVGARLADSGWQTIIVGAPAEAELIGTISCAIPRSLAITNRSVVEIAALMRRAAVVISNDSGLMHLAAGLSIPLVAIFGPTVPEFGFYPFRARAVVLEQALACRPCSAMGSRECPQRHFRCMLDTQPEAVAAAAIGLAGKPDDAHS